MKRLGPLLAMLVLLAMSSCKDSGSKTSSDDALIDAAKQPDGGGWDAAPADARTVDADQGQDAKPDGTTQDAGQSADADVDGGQQAPTEILLYDGKNLQFTAADRGFLPLIEPGDVLPLDDWTTPYDFYDGEFHIRYVITAPADQVEGKLQVCIWTMGNEDGDGRDFFPESCSDSVSHQGVGTYENTNVVPSAWWRNDGVPLDFSHPERFLIRVVLRGASGCNVTNYNVPGSCWDEWPLYQDMTFSVTIVMVAPGATFSGWSNYP